MPLEQLAMQGLALGATASGQLKTFRDSQRDSAILCGQLDRELHVANRIFVYAIACSTKESPPPFLLENINPLVDCVRSCKEELAMATQPWYSSCSACVAGISGGGVTPKTLKLQLRELEKYVGRCTGPLERYLIWNPHMCPPVEFEVAQRILVYGEVGAGKSNLIQELTGLSEHEIKTGKAASGVTKDVTSYFFRRRQKLYMIVDCPGAGDDDVSISVVLDRLLQEYGYQCGKLPGRFAAVAFVVNGENPRFAIGSKFVSKILQLAFCTEGDGNHLNAFGNRIMVIGTRADLIPENDYNICFQEVKNIASKVESEAGIKMPNPDLQVILKKKGDTERVAQCLREVVERKGPALEFNRPSENDLFNAFQQVHGAHMTIEELREDWDKTWVKPRERECLAQLDEARAQCNPKALVDALQYARALFGDDASDRLAEYEDLNSKWEPQIKEIIAELDQICREPDQARLSKVQAMCRRFPYVNQHEGIKQKLQLALKTAEQLKDLERFEKEKATLVDERVREQAERKEQIDLLSRSHQGQVKAMDQKLHDLSTQKTNSEARLKAEIQAEQAKANAALRAKFEAENVVKKECDKFENQLRCFNWEKQAFERTQALEQERLKRHIQQLREDQQREAKSFSARLGFHTQAAQNAQRAQEQAEKMLQEQYNAKRQLQLDRDVQLINAQAAMRDKIKTEQELAAANAKLTGQAREQQLAQRVEVVGKAAAGPHRQQQRPVIGVDGEYNLNRASPPPQACTLWQ